MTRKEELKQAAADFIKGGYWNTDYIVEFVVEQISKARHDDTVQVENIAVWNQDELNFQRRAILAILALKIKD